MATSSQLEMEVVASLDPEDISSAFEDDDEPPQPSTPDDQKDLEPQQQQQNNDTVEDDEEWSNHDDDLKFDDDDYIPPNEEELEAHRNTLHDTITSASIKEEDPLNEESIIQNVSICLGFLLHKKSPLWRKGKKKHHSTKKLIKNRKTKKNKMPTFSERCSIFKSDYVIGHEGQNQTNNTSAPVQQTHSIRNNPALLGDIKAKPHERLFKKIISEIDEDTMKEKWRELIVYWDSWEGNQGRTDEAHQLRFDWDEYTDDIITVSVKICFYDFCARVYNPYTFMSARY